MVGFSLIQDFVTKIQKIDDLQELQQTFDEEIKLLGFDKHTCVSLVDINRPPPRCAIALFLPGNVGEALHGERIFQG